MSNHSFDQPLEVANEIRAAEVSYHDRRKSLIEEQNENEEKLDRHQKRFQKLIEYKNINEKLDKSFDNIP